MRLPWRAARLHVHAPTNLAGRLKRRHQGGDKRGAAQQTGAQRPPTGGRAPLAALGRLAQAVWQRIMAQPRRGVDTSMPAMAMPLLWSPVLRVICAVILPRAAVTRPPDKRRPHTLRAHAQSRWRRAVGWA